jgi:hypothetical protein
MNVSVKDKYGGGRSLGCADWALGYMDYGNEVKPILVIIEAKEALLIWPYLSYY